MSGGWSAGLNLDRLVATIRASHVALHESVPHRDESDAARERWVAAAAEFRALEAEFESIVGDLLDGLAVGLGDGIDEAIGFLEIDPWCFRSGYAKARLMRRFITVPLERSHFERLAGVIVRSVRVGTRWEMTDTMRLARRIGGRSLRRDLRALMHDDEDRSRAWRAMVVLTRLRQPRLTDRDRLVVRRLVLWDLERLDENGREPWPESWSLRAGRLVLDDAWASELERRGGPDGHGPVARSLLQTRRG